MGTKCLIFFVRLGKRGDLFANLSVKRLAVEGVSPSHRPALTHFKRGSVIIIIKWLVQSWTLPFVRACSMPVNSALGGRRLLAQC